MRLMTFSVSSECLLRACSDSELSPGATQGRFGRGGLGTQDIRHPATIKLTFKITLTDRKFHFREESRGPNPGR